MKNLQENTVPAQSQNQTDYFHYSNPTDTGNGLCILYVGNSISKHAPKPEIGWYRDCGMAASDTEYDYIHILQKKITTTRSDVSFSILQVANFERNFDTKNIEKDESFQKAREFQADIIVMFFGANVSHDYDEGKPFVCSFGEAYEKLRRYLDPAQKAKVVHVQGFYIREKLNVEKEAVAQKCNDIYVELGDIRTREDTHGEFNHPSDLGMQLIAERIWETVKNWI